MLRANPNPSAADSTGGNGQSCQSYLLRLWQKEDAYGWLASLQDVRSGERYGFTTLRDLFSFVEVKTEEVKE